MRKFYIKVIIFSALCVLILNVLDGYFIHGKVLHTTLNNLIEQKENYDLVYMGNSLSRRSYDIPYIDSALNTKSINIGSEAQHFFITNAIFNELIDDDAFSTTKLLIVTISPWQFSQFDADWWRNLQMAALDELSYSKEYFKLVNKFYKVSEYPKVLSSTIRFHSNLSEEFINTSKQLSKFNKTNPNGFSLNIAGKLNEKQKNTKFDLKIRAEKYSNEIQNLNQVKLDEESEKSILNIIKKCREKKLNLLFITPPSVDMIYNTHAKGIIKYFEKLFKLNNTKYLDLNNYFNELNLGYNDFNDFAHLNKFGAKKTAPFLVNYLLNDLKTKKTVDKIDELKNIGTKEQTVKKINIPFYTSWGKQRLDLEETAVEYNQEKVFRMSRNTIEASSYAHTQNISVNFESTYRVSVVVKGSEVNVFFGLRIVGSYPDRADAIFNLKEGTLVGVKKERDFRNPEASIEAMGDGWYKCSLTAEPYSDIVRILFGPTGEDKAVLGWEGLINKKNDIFILPSSLTLEEIKP